MREDLVRVTRHTAQTRGDETDRRPLRPTASSTVAFALAVLLCVFASSADAAVGHLFVSGLLSSGADSFVEPSPIAVDRASGDVFVGDPAAGYVDVFDGSGKYLTRLGEGGLSATGVAVDEASGRVYVADAAEDAVDVFNPDGSGGYALVGAWSGEASPGKAFGEVTGVAVDNSKGASAGDVLVVDAEDPELSEGVVDVFKPKPAGPEEGGEGELVRVLSKGKMEEPYAIAIDSSTGRVYVGDSLKGSVFEYSPTGAYEGKLTGKGGPEGTFDGPEEEEGNVAALAVDPVSGDLLVAEAERGVVGEFNTAGESIGWIASSPAVQLGEPHGLGVSATGDVYVADSLLGKVDIFGPGVVVPDVATSKASKVTRTTALLGGTVNGDGQPGHVFFEYGTSRTFGSSTSPLPFAGGEEKVAISASELHAGTLYYYRLAAENENGTNYGATKELETPTAVEGLSTGAVSNLQPTSTTLNGSLSPNGVDAHYYFQWGKTTSYGSETPSEDAGSGTGSAAAKAELTGLSPNTVYHYRLVATNSYGTTDGADQSFTTPGPPRITYKPVSGLGHETGTLNAEVNPDELETSYHYEYGETEAYGTETPAGGADIGSGGTPLPETASLTALKLGVTYHYRLVATNSAGTTTGPDQTFTTIPPALTASYASEVTPTTATLSATINPLGNDTHYYFQYGTEPCTTSPSACTDNPAAPGEDIGSEETPVEKTLALTELAPDTTYHYRIIATNTLGTAEGTEHTITTPKPTQPVALPDNRAWEMVTPPDKGAAPVEALTREGGIILASETGEKLTYVVDGALGEHVEGNRSPEAQQILATRTPALWTSQDIATPNAKATGLASGLPPEYQYFSADLESALVEPAAPEPYLAPGLTHATPYLRMTATGAYVPLVTDSDTTPGSLSGTTVEFAGSSADLSHVVVRASAALTGPGSAAGLYQWYGGRLTFVTTLPDGVSATAPELGFRGRVVSGAVSSTGARVVWTNRAEATGAGHLYMRDTARGETLQLDAAQGTPEPPVGSAQFQGATPDGSRVFFTDKQKLTANSTAEPKFPEKADLYECEVVEEAGRLACHLRDLTIDTNQGEHASVQGLVLGISADGSRVYFVAKGVLAENRTGTGAQATPEANNLYSVRDDGPETSTRFIASLSPEDAAEWEGNALADATYVTARTSPNGRYFAFMSEADLTGYDNVDANPEAKGARAEEVYLYDSAAEKLICVSCDPTGARPRGVLDRNAAGEGLGLLVDRREEWGGAGHEHWLGGNLPGWTAESLTTADFQSRYLADNGRLFFDSPDELVPAATNHKENVYEYEPAGVGSCTGQPDGCIDLLSSGTSLHESAFLEATPSGNDVFFLTAAPLLPQDIDTAFDIYDARVCSAEAPCQTTPPPAPESCAAVETCRPVLPPAPYLGSQTGTGTYNGPGSPQPTEPKAEVKASTVGKAPAKHLTRAEMLAKALAACRHHYPRSKHKRKACYARARARYSPRKSKGPHK